MRDGHCAIYQNLKKKKEKKRIKRKSKVKKEKGGDGRE